MHEVENMPLQPSTNFLPSLTDEPIGLFFQYNPLCGKIRIGNRVRVKSFGVAPGLANNRSSGKAKFAYAPPRD